MSESHALPPTTTIRILQNRTWAKSSLNRYQRVYFHCFLLALLFCWSPSNALAYLTPLCVLSWFIFATASSRVVRNVCVFLLLWTFIVAIQVLLHSTFALHSAALSLLTYSGFIVIATIPSRWLANIQLFEQMQKWIYWVIIVEACLGIAQAVYGYSRTGTLDVANGDYVEGTIHPGLMTESSFSNPIFAVGLVLLLISMLYTLFIQKKGRAVFFLGMAAFILASVMHVVILLMGAITISVLLYTPTFFRRKSGCLLVLFFLISVATAALLLRSNFSTLSNFVTATVRAETPRAQVVIRVINEMPEEYPWMPLIGIGPGQFSSRAGLIGTGRYFGRPDNPIPLPLIPIGMSDAFQKYVFDLWINFAHRPGYKSSTVMPFFSWLSVYVEMGSVVLLSIFVWVAVTLLRIKLRIRYQHQRIMAISCGTGVLLILFLGVQENYWEVPQALLPGMMLLKVQYAILMKKEGTLNVQ